MKKYSKLLSILFGASILTGSIPVYAEDVSIPNEQKTEEICQEQKDSS